MNYVYLLKLWMHARMHARLWAAFSIYSIFIFITFEFCVCENALWQRENVEVCGCVSKHITSWNKNYDSRSNRDADDDRLVFVFSDSLHSVHESIQFSRCAMCHRTYSTSNTEYNSFHECHEFGLYARELEITQGVSERDRKRLNMTMCERRICWNCLCGTAQTRHSYYVLHIYYVMNFCCCFARSSMYLMSTWRCYDYLLLLLRRRVT